MELVPRRFAGGNNTVWSKYRESIIADLYTLPCKSNAAMNANDNNALADPGKYQL